MAPPKRKKGRPATKAIRAQKKGAHQGQTAGMKRKAEVALAALEEHVTSNPPDIVKIFGVESPPAQSPATKQADERYCSECKRMFGDDVKLMVHDCIATSHDGVCALCDNTTLISVRRLYSCFHQGCTTRVSCCGHWCS